MGSHEVGFALKASSQFAVLAIALIDLIVVFKLQDVIQGDTTVIEHVPVR